MLVEAVPNISLGPQDPELDEVLAEVRSATSPGLALLDVHTDRDHRRTVLTLAGAPVPLLRGLDRLTEALLGHASLADHAGVHPRIGMLDVVPFVGLKAPEFEVQRLADTAAGRLARRSIPVYRYARLARREKTLDLASIRSRLAQTRPGAKPPLPPDDGPGRLHDSMGAACVGVRGPLIAYNVVLNTTDLDTGAAIARQIRATDGGLSSVQALAFPLASRGDHVQISTNITDTRERTPSEVFRRVEEEAASRAIEVLEGELVGLAPSQALPKDPSEMGLESQPMSLEAALEDAGFYVEAVP